MGYGDIAPFGSKLNRTPNLGRLAAEGMKLTSFYCAPVCSASRAQLMTGCYSKRVGIGGALPPVASRGLNPNEITVAELLRARGYATMMIGKWHLGDQPEFLPTRQGFDHYLGLPYSNDMGGDGKPKKQPKSGKTETRPPLPLLRDEQVIEAPVEQDTLTARYTEAAVQFIATHTNQPFFLYLAHTAVHVPLYPGQAFRGKSANGLYGDWVEESDWSVGRVMDALRRAHLGTNTLVLFTSDNGPWLSKGTNAGSAGPLRGGKFSTWEGGSREPAIAWWPGQIAAGTTSDAVLSQMDVLPTVARLAGGEAPTDRVIDGRDIWPVLSGQTKDSPHEALFYFAGNTLEAVRSGPWKLAIAPQGKSKKDDDPDKVSASYDAPRLYNLDTDISETTDVAAVHPEVVKRLKTLLERMDGDLGLRGDKALGVRRPGNVSNPKPLLKRGAHEYD
jgi:arylsulfatase A-like enzyme